MLAAYTANPRPTKDHDEIGCRTPIRASYLIFTSILDLLLTNCALEQKPSDVGHVKRGKNSSLPSLKRIVGPHKEQEKHYG